MNFIYLNFYFYFLKKKKKDGKGLHPLKGNSLKSTKFVYSHERHYIFLKSILKAVKRASRAGAISQIFQQIGQSPTSLSINK
jgi:hypothetical protein